MTCLRLGQNEGCRALCDLAVSIRAPLPLSLSKMRMTRKKHGKEILFVDYEGILL